MKIRQFISSIFLASCGIIPQLTMAAPARQGVITYTQPDGSTIEVLLHGDEHTNWYSDLQDRPLKADADGKLTAADASWLEQRIKRTITAKSASQKPHKATQLSFPTSGSQKVLVVLVEFQDRSFTYNYDNFNDMLNAPGYSAMGAAGSASDYFRDNSYGIFTPEFDVYGPVKLSQNMAYYGGNDDANAHKMAVEACRQLDSTVDFSEYDRDHDGWIDNIYIFYAGYGEADGGGSNTVWPHAANIYQKGETLMLDGVMAGGYACSNELMGNTTSMVGIGTFCHEFSHVLGLPDLYATNGSDIDTPYYWSLMEHGNYNGNGRCPASLTAYEKYYLGWLSPIVITETDRGTIRLPELSEGLAYKVDMPGNENEYYFLEHRTRKGWDAGLPAEGLLIWHIDYDPSAWADNRVNNDPARQRVDLIEAGGNPSLYKSASHPFPGESQIRSFESFTPRFSNPLNIKISDINLTSGIIYFDLNGASELPSAPQAPIITDTDDISISLSSGGDSSQLFYSVTQPRNGRSYHLAPHTLKALTNGDMRIDDLEPESNYEIRLWQRQGVAFSAPSAAATATTEAALFGGNAPVALEATEISADGFTANWESLQDAEEYLISVYSMVDGGANETTSGFNAGEDLPSGWNTNVTTTMSVKGYYGNAAPSLRMSNNADFLQSAISNEDITNISFWMRGYKATSTTKIILEGYTVGNWQQFWQSENISNSEGTTVTLHGDAIPEGTKALKLTLVNPESGSVCIDDFTVGYGTKLVRDYLISDQSAGNSLSYRFESTKPLQNCNYYVVGVKGERKSAISNHVAVNPDTSYAEIITEDSDACRIFNIDGTQRDNRSISDHGIYIIRKSNGKSQKIIK
ncbi:MAG: M6 family metalloprotease domain-containing protein [Muribaculaceae bacterium]|nr:M6 family metalloprotease domain-containing protein [Muribaculaceae bacterium]